MAIGPGPNSRFAGPRPRGRFADADGRAVAVTDIALLYGAAWVIWSLA